MTPLVAPAVALMNRLRYPQKFALIALLFAIPLGLMMLTILNDVLDVSKMEAGRLGAASVDALCDRLDPCLTSSLNRLAALRL
jgi:hypothetical protein